MVGGWHIYVCIAHTHARPLSNPKHPQPHEPTQDPIIRQVLTDLQENPAAGRQALADPGVAAKIEKLIAAGVLRTG